ncbi:MAG: sigma-54 dependent transcriptional regulator [Deltaproteobacteria bacterium]|nr:sigma-54 dependent transcriptional regulator [Deltaproteobacteria bacterium]
MRDKALIIEDDPDYSEFLYQITHNVFEVTLTDSVDNAKSELENHKFDIIVSDYRLHNQTCEQIIMFSRASPMNKYTPIVVLSNIDDLRLVSNLFNLGIDDFISKSCSIDEILCRLTSAKRIRDLYYHAEKVVQENEELKKLLGMNQIIGEASSFKQVLSTLDKIAQTDAPVLLLGETGVGKDVLARYIHNSSKRVGRFVSVNVTALPQDLIESELFGHEKGSFSGATQSKPGLMEIANKGTFFIDEIGDMPIELQPKLLRVLQDKRIRKLGSIKESFTDFRLVCATCKDLHALMKEGKFREDLYYRINLITIKIPSLRERKSDIPLLANYFLDLAELRFGMGKKSVSDRTIRSLLDYSWPGNVRELENIIYRLYLMTDEDYIDVDVAVELIENRKDTKKDTSTNKHVHKANDENCIFDLETKISLVEKSLFEEALIRAKGNKSKAAKLLGISRVTLLQKMKKYGFNL